jgi:hypothetical protein
MKAHFHRGENVNVFARYLLLYNMYSSYPFNNFIQMSWEVSLVLPTYCSSPHDQSLHA